jgi:hypothetical protein
MKISRIIKELKVEGSLHYSARFEDRATMQRFSASSSRRCTKRLLMKGLQIKGL